jgi:hypothetical protein
MEHKSLLLAMIILLALIAVAIVSTGKIWKIGEDFQGGLESASACLKWAQGGCDRSIPKDLSEAYGINRDSVLAECWRVGGVEGYGGIREYLKNNCNYYE